MDFHCYSCGDPISGGVSQTRCIDCMLGIYDEDEGPECALCGDTCQPEEEHCLVCQAELDTMEADCDEYATTVRTEEFDATLDFLFGRETDA